MPVSSPLSSFSVPQAGRVKHPIKHANKHRNTRILFFIIFCIFSSCKFISFFYAAHRHVVHQPVVESEEDNKDG